MRLLARPPALVAVAATVLAVVLASPSLTAQSAPPAQSATGRSTVLPATMQKLLPSPPGWTRGLVRAERAALSETAGYTFAYAVYTNADMKVRITIADTGLEEGALAALATMIMTFKDDYAGQIPPATTIKRSVYKGSPASELWDASSNDGEFTVLVGGRFVVKVEGSRLTDQTIPRTIVDGIDLQALGALK